MVLQTGSTINVTQQILYDCKIVEREQEEIKNEKKTLSEKLVTLKDEEDKLNSDIKKLKDPEYVARYAREKYMYSKDGELIIRLPDDDTDK